MTTTVTINAACNNDNEIRVHTHFIDNEIEDDKIWMYNPIKVVLQKEGFILQNGESATRTISGREVLTVFEQSKKGG